MAKGATYEEAQRLTALKQSKENKNETIVEDSNKTKSDNDNSDDKNNDNDIFLKQHREKRLKELQKQKYGSVIPIQRNEWNHQVNDASEDGTWVIINLTAQKSSPNLHPMHKDICTHIEDSIIPQLAHKFSSTKFVSIPSCSAVENWPENNLPTLFCYRFGKLQCQMVGLEEFGITDPNIDTINSFKHIEWRLGKLGVLQVEDLDDENSEEDEEDSTTARYNKNNHKSTRHSNGEKKYGRSHFGGGMAQLQTGKYSDDESDYDDVD